MKSAIFAFLALLLATLAAHASTTVNLPNGAAWVVVAPRADRFAKEAGALFDTASKYDPPLSSRLLNNDFLRQTGLGLLSTEELVTNGIDTSKPWTIFARQGATYLDAFVKDRAKTQSALEAWGAGRLLKAREEKAIANGATLVTFSRARGTRAAAGYVLTKDRVVVLLRPADRTPNLEQALAAVEDGAPVRAGADGTLLVWAEAAPVARETWIGLQASEKGVELNGTVRDLSPGWVATDAARASWIGALAQNGGGSAALRLRTVARERLARELARLFTEASGPADAGAADALETLATGPDELLVARLVPPERGAGGLSVEAITNVLAPAMAMPDRPKIPDVLHRVDTPAGALEVLRLGSSALAALGSNAPRTLPPEPSGSANLSCSKGKPIAALRVDGARIESSLEGIGLFGAMRDELLLGLYGLHSEFGLLLTKLDPVVVFACQDGSRTTLTGRLRFH